MNTTLVEQTGNGSFCSPINPSAEKLAKTVAYCLITVVSLVGNSLIGIIVYKTPTLRKPINLLIVNMATSDLLFPVILFPIRLAELHVCSWPINGGLGQALCKLHVFLADASTSVSIQSLVLITVDRFGAVVFPLRSPIVSPKLCAFFIPVTWIVAMTIVSPYLFAFQLVEDQEGIVCERQWREAFGEKSSYAIYFLIIAIVFVYIPTVLLAAFYSIIMIKLKKQAHPGEQSANAEEQRTRRNRNVLKMAIAIVAVFFICWIPFFSTQLMFYFTTDSSIRSCCSLIDTVTLFMAYANCAINPIICLVFSSNYRYRIKRLLTCESVAVQG
ncbi:unnamed protein product [Porites evermanni]|uniref:G-protein coupled receptors family 1 profile domain-containing protein n=1 Tax=Porites evermanni TaxID=104178 RepID=A0ABN8SME0_9CNID|nr:unnamed protein product [Porites evermanni]